MQLIHVDIVCEDLRKAGVRHTHYYTRDGWQVEIPQLAEGPRFFGTFGVVMAYIRDGCPGAIKEGDDATTA